MFGMMAVASVSFYRAMKVWGSERTGMGIHQVLMSVICLGALAAAYFILYPPA
jgi:hypothetical protein